MKPFLSLIILALLFLLQACSGSTTETKMNKDGNQFSKEDLPQSESAWKEVLSSEQYKILRKKGTERSFHNEYWDNKNKGDYTCAGCGQVLFSSTKKFKSGTGWPSFTEPVNSTNVEEHADNSLFAKRTEILCSRCKGHLGHVFNDGPGANGLRYCINSAALSFKEKK